MRRPIFWLVVSLLCFAGALYFWKLGDDWAARKKGAPASTTPAAGPGQTAPEPRAANQAGPLRVSSTKALTRLTNSSALTYRVSNTTNGIGKLNRSETAILLENALIDTANKAEMQVPEHLRSHGNPGAYIVQARGAINNAFRAAIQGAGGKIVSYIPNNALLVQATQDLAASLSSSGLVQSVLPYEPYYKLKPQLLEPALKQALVPEGTVLNLLLFPGTVGSATADLNSLGAQIVGPTDRSPFGPVLHVVPPRGALPAIAQLPSVQEMELARPRITANDLSRATLGVSPDSITSTNYLDLSGTNITVGVIDTGIDATHPDLTGRILMDQPDSGVDTDGHGTFVAGMIAGTGAMSTTIGTNVQGSIVPVTNGQFRGKAPIANLFSMSLANGSDTYFQETAAAQTNLLIANNSWSYGNSDYDLAAASYDAAVRDAVPETTGSRQLAYVFPAGNGGGANVWDGGINDGGTGGTADRIQSPGTAKNVITVGAIEQFRNITNETFEVVGIDTNGQPLFQTNQPWLPSTDSSDQVAGFSSRGNVGIGVEGDSGRFKPDVVAPGTFVISTRSSQWDTNAYYNPTSHTVQVFRRIVLHTNATFFNEVFLPFNVVGLTLEVFPNFQTPLPFPDMPIFVRQDQNPILTNGTGGYLFVRTNVVNMPPDGGPTINVVDDFWHYGIPNPSPSNTVIFDLVVDVAVTNAHGNFLDVLKTNLNDPIGPWYRYESGTSIAAADASGLLALMEEFQQRSGMFSPTNRPSPALMKALLINGSRSVGDIYDFDVKTPVNFQGWGLPNLPNSLPTSLSNLNTTASTGSSMYLFEQSPTNALSTGQKQTRLITLNQDAQNAPLHITLAWTDPPGNPVAGKKLVNDLDLVVTNLDTGDVFFGNDIIAGNDFNQAWDTNSLPNVDVVNNLENVYLLNPLGSNYSVTVIGSRVNVNAVTIQSNQVVQDYALVISSDANFTNGLTLPNTITTTNGTTITADPGTPNPPTVPLMTVITNQFATIDTNISGGILLNQRVGASTPLLGTNMVPPSNAVPLMGPTAGLITIGMTNQWHFYVLTNDNGFTNAAFLTFLPATLSIPRIGVRADTLDNSTRPEADIDLYVSTDPALTNLNPTVLSNSLKSLTRDGTETIALTNAVKGTYYMAVKAEDQEASEFAIAGLFSLLPFDQNQDGNHLLMGIPSSAPIPDGSPQHPGGVNILAICTGPIQVHRVIVTNTISHELVGDLEGTLTHNRTGVVLNNHTAGGQVVNQTYIYDDSQEHNVASIGTIAPQRSDGPGSLMDFGGKQGAGQWMLTMVDDALGHIGTNQQLWIYLEKQQDLANGVTNTILPGACVEDFIDIPVGATNLTITAGLLTPGGPVSVTVCPQDGGGCQSTNIGGGFANTNIIVIDKFSNPPLNPGTYIVTSCNNGSTTVQEYLKATIQVDINGVVPTRFTSTGPVPIADDAVTTQSLFVTNNQKVVSVEVGLRVDHPRVSDLVFHLISPSGTRSLLFENRGALSPDGMGSSVITTNIVPTSSNGGNEPQTNSIDTGITNWSATISYDMFGIPDEMAVYSGSNLLVDTGMVAGPGTLNLTNPPGGSTVITIIMNPKGNPSQITQWTYTVTSVRAQYYYFTFTEDTNKTVTPIKFYVPPYLGVLGTNSSISNTVIVSGGFENVTSPQYNMPAGTVFGGWRVTQGNVDLYNAPSVNVPTSDGGTNFIDLTGDQIGGITTNFPTIPGNAYVVSFAYCKNPVTLVPTFVASNTVAITGQPTQVLTYGFANSTARPGWSNATFTFVAAGPTTSLTLNSLENVNNGGMWVDSFRITRVLTSASGSTNGDVLPEETLEKLKTENAKGQWQLEVWDNRSGPAAGSNAPPTLVSWQLSFIFQNTVPAPIGLQHGTPVTNTVCSGQVQYYTVAVPVWARFASNALSVLSLPFPPGVNVWFNQSNPPTLTNGPGDVLLFPNTTQSGTVTLSTNTPPPVNPPLLVPGQTYYLAVQNTNTACVQYSYELDYDVTPLTLNIPTNSAQASGSLQQYFSYVVTSNETAVSFIVTNIVGGNVDLVVSKGLPFPDLGTFDYGSFNPGTFNEDIIVFTNSDPVPLSAGTWYLGVFNRDPSNVTYQVLVTEDTNAVPNIITLFNSIPYTNTAPVGSSTYYRYHVTPNESGVLFQLTNLVGGNVDLYLRRGFPLPSATSFDYESVNLGTANEVIQVFTNSTPISLTPGDWYLTVVNPDVNPVTYVAVVNDFVAPTNNIINLTNGIAYANTNFGGVTNQDFYHYTVSANAVRAQFEIDGASGPMALAVRRGPPLPSASSRDYFSSNAGPGDQLITVFTNSTPVGLTPGDWYLTAINLNGSSPVTYSIKASDWASLGTNIVLHNPTLSSNEFCFSWDSLIGVHYFVQAKVDLPGAWTTIWTNVATATNTTFCIPLPSQYHFFRVGQGLAPTVSAPAGFRITSITRSPGGIILKWSAPSGTTAQVQWTPSLSPPAWNTFTNVVTSTNGLGAFVDDGSQSGGIGPTRFYRLVQ